MGKLNSLQNKKYKIYSMKHLNEYEDEDLESLLGDLGSLGILNGRVIIEFFINRHGARFDNEMFI